MTSLCWAPLSLKQNRGESLFSRFCFCEGNSIGRLNKGYIVTNCALWLIHSEAQKKANVLNFYHITIQINTVLTCRWFNHFGPAIMTNKNNKFSCRLSLLPHSQERYPYKNNAEKLMLFCLFSFLVTHFGRPQQVVESKSNSKPIPLQSVRALYTPGKCHPVQPDLTTVHIIRADLVIRKGFRRVTSTQTDHSRGAG